jgi:DNA-binding PadR family transcriptional regulator
MKESAEAKQKSSRTGRRDRLDPNLDNYVDRIIKSNLDVVVLTTLAETPMCGYDLIKDIFLKYNVFLSQGTIYPLLYTLKEKGILQAEFGKGDMRSKVYYITPKGEEIVKDVLNEFTKAIDYVMDQVRGEYNV